jgi:hypothetical protein
VVALTEIDFRQIGSGRMGPVSHKLQNVFHAVVCGDHPRADGWLAYVN